MLCLKTACTAVNRLNLRIRFCVLFLSCLYGSEPSLCEGGRRCSFLSCLYGSEPVAACYVGISTFLSCLYGSELE